MKLILAAALFTLAPLAHAAEFPSEFTIREEFFSLTTSLDVKAGGKDFGTVSQKLLSLTRSFRYTDAAGACLAEARSRILTWGSHVDVTDCSGTKIGGIKEQVFKSLFKVHTTYSILDAADRVVAVSTKVEWISTFLEMTKPTGEQVATMQRPWLSIPTDRWTIKIVDKTAVDPRLIVMIAAYKTSVDNARRKDK